MWRFRIHVSEKSEIWKILILKRLKIKNFDQKCFEFLGNIKIEKFKRKQNPGNSTIFSTRDVKGTEQSGTGTAILCLFLIYRIWTFVIC